MGSTKLTENSRYLWNTTENSLRQFPSSSFSLPPFLSPSLSLFLAFYSPYPSSLFFSPLSSSSVVRQILWLTKWKELSPRSFKAYTNKSTQTDTHSPYFSAWGHVCFPEAYFFLTFWCCYCCNECQFEVMSTKKKQIPRTKNELIVQVTFGNWYFFYFQTQMSA